MMAIGSRAPGRATTETGGVSDRRRRARHVGIGAIAAIASAMAMVGAGPVGVRAADPFVPIATVALGSTATFGALTPAAFSSTGATIFRGDIGAATFAFAPAGTHIGSVYLGTDADPARADLAIAYADAVGRPAGTALAGAMDGITVGPGVYTSVGAAGLAAAGTFTLDGEGHDDAVFLFQVNGALSMGAGAKLILINGAQAKNVFWQAVGGGAFGANITFAGTLLSNAAVSSGAGSTINGRLLTKAGAIAVDGNDVYSSPPSVSITGGPAASTTATNPLISGSTSVRSPSTVTVTIDGDIDPTHPVPNASGNWSVTPSVLLANGDHDIVASVVDGAGNIGTFTQVLTVDTIPPAVTIDGGPTAATNSLSPTIRGTTDVAAGRPVTITLTRTAPSLILNRATVVQADLTWNIAPNGLTAGEWTIVARVVDPAGNPNTATQVLTIDVTAPIVTITSSVLTNNPTPTISGTTETGSIVAVVIDGVGVPGVVVTGTTWTAATTVTLGHGTHNLSVTATDAVGNTSAAVTQNLLVDLILPIIGIDPGPTDATNDQTPTIAGTTDVVPGAGVIVSVVIDGGVAHIALVQSGGAWNVTPSALLAPGDHTVVASVADPAGNVGSATQTLTVDIDAPAVVIAGGPSRTTSDATPTITGSSSGVAVGAPVTVTIGGQTLTTTIAAGGAFSVTAAPLVNATHVVFVTVTDAAGNVGNATQALTILAVAPTVTYANGPTASTNDATPLIAGSTSAAVGSTVVVNLAGQTLHATVQPGGSWNVTAASLADGTVTILTEITDAFGNVGGATQSLTVYTVPPVVVIGGGGGTVGTTDPTPAITGSGATPGSTVTVSVAGQTMTTVVAPDGTWSVTPPNPLPAGANPVTVTITDPAGNTGSGTQVIVVSPAPPGTQPPGSPAVDFTSVGPKRVFDTRAGQSPNALRNVAKQQVAGGYELQVRMTDLPGYVPATGVGAVSLNVTSTESKSDGFITVYACGTRETVSSINYVAGQTIANAVITPVAGNGNVCFYANRATDIIVDINGWFASGSAFNAVGPKRVFDTRPADSPDALRNVGKSKVSANTTMEVRLTDLAGYVPSAGVGAVSLNVVVTNPEAPGFITVYACGTLGQVSSVNYVAGQTIANAVIAPVSATGTVCFYTLATTDLIVDVNGWIQAGSGFHGVDPARVLDTRPGQSANAIRTVAKAKIGGGHVLQVKVTDLPGIVPASGVSAVSLNVTATNTEAGGFITVFACGTMEEVSSLNFDAGATVANAVIAPVSASGTICLFANQMTDVIVDINGWIAG